MPRAMPTHMQNKEACGADELLRRLHSGDERAYAELWCANHRRLFALAYRILRDGHDAEDAVQDAFTSLVRKIGEFRGEAKIQTWLHVVVSNAAKMRLRKRKITPRLLSHESPLLELLETGADSCPTARMSRLDTAAWLRRGIDALDPIHRDIIRMRIIEHCDTQECARRLGITPMAVGSRYFRARAALREMVAQEMERRCGSVPDSIGA